MSFLATVSRAESDLSSSSWFFYLLKPQFSGYQMLFKTSILDLFLSFPPSLPLFLSLPPSTDGGRSDVFDLLSFILCLFIYHQWFTVGWFHWKKDDFHREARAGILLHKGKHAEGILSI